MRAEKKKKLEAAGWKVGDASDFLDLSPEEAALVDLRIKLTDAVRRIRQERHWTQTTLASKISSSQSRIAKIEAGDPSVSLDLVFRSLFALGISHDDVAKILRVGWSRRVDTHYQVCRYLLVQCIDVDLAANSPK